uniref:SCP domain-containing protein n=1 Tax=Haemonchus contortus TaxID=6289 RepID=A0A7I4YTL0_HAECO
MNDRIRANALMAHNYRRSRLAQGLVENKRGRTLPPATNMLQLLYDCNLETSAVMAAMKCSATGSSSLPSDVQENHYLVPKGEAQYRKDAIIEGVKKWWSQIRIDGGIGQGVTYTQFNVGKPISWFTRMAWATTQTFGCGVRSCGNRWSVVCHYKPGGNKLNEHIYIKGEACSRCPSNTFCDPSTKLCAPVSTA